MPATCRCMRCQGNMCGTCFNRVIIILVLLLLLQLTSDTICVCPLQVDNIFAVIHQVATGLARWLFKDHRQRIPKNCYKTIFRKINTEEIFSNLHSLQIKTIFQEKNLNLRKFTVAVCVIYIYGCDVTHWCQL